MKIRHLDERPALDLGMFLTKQTFGDLTLFCTWLGVDVANSEPCLALIPTFRIRGVKPCVVPLSSAYLWDDVKHAAKAAVEFCDCLGIDPGPANCARIVGIIHSRLPDLVAMPVRPHRYSVVGASGIIVDDSGHTRHGEIIHEI